MAQRDAAKRGPHQAHREPRPRRRPELAVSIIASLLASFGCRRVEESPPRPAASTRTDEGATTPDPATPQTVSGTTVVIPEFARVAREVGPSVVTVISTVRDGNAARTGAARNKVVRGLGSGMIVSANGQVLTNEHVIASATRVDVELSNRDRIPAKVLLSEPLLDLALLELEGPAPGLVPVEFREADPVPGEWVMAMGQPFGLGHTVTVGVISGLGRDHTDLGRPDGLRSDGIWSFIQTDASINIGNSGGPLVDAEGAVVGITSAVRNDGQGVAFAIPAPMARRFLEEAWTHGRFRKARLGIKADNSPTPAVSDADLARRGAVVRVTEVDETGPAAKAGILEGDVVLDIAGKSVDRVSDVAYLTQLLGVGARVPVTIKRVGQGPQQVIVIPAETK
jgi:S1-C subfamily serine protease